MEFAAQSRDWAAVISQRIGVLSDLRVATKTDENRRMGQDGWNRYVQAQVEQGDFATFYLG